ncbi:conserved Plasmodium protein, unknown function [Plasmodium knowlesi strain H]|uniref:Uncharacterized protein n=3 Tax=Plasmodium knowlesi TaxID=5850 RepID=A0A5K1U0P7_PLAKH|nr:conserved Plasmodium protein, unknown function [Plasmodium knowlesi strain H]OTN68661.1 Uncharacterized protein PKNOH_S01019100 [Plasmodium knowlesi]CAA9986188.1 conserved Plasmodium protein, unknown function [Plasmodium knowlesi strain H]SBO25388.1 conserved Plasmodium protein, unknown function [Plasmodium knowlesi strain H]SBO27682.1 conserved Plasmodium protein, unknown function [Plasmodium knowlesi strain H]VVS75662.1 conserved Plasmodium protein, unknown function [Plasmodium knowlesi s|eukprot:XP_002257598.1 hypothetical protein, conserved in Plasmodium species [Plasmodium knowlesi strain H]
MKIRNYIFGKVTDPYSHIEKIKGLLDWPAGNIKSKWRATNFVQSCVRRYDEEVEKKSYKIKYHVHASLREDFLPSEGNRNEELLFSNRYIYFEHDNGQNILVCRKKIRRKFSTNIYFHNINKSLDDLKREGYISKEISEIVAILPKNCLIKYFCTKGNRFSAFVVERSDCYVNWGYVFRGSCLVRDANLDHATYVPDSRGGLSPGGNDRRGPFRVRPPKGGRSRGVQNVPLKGAHPFAGQSKRPRHQLLYQREGVQNIVFLQTRYSKDFSPTHFYAPDFLTTELDEKHRCSRLFLNSSSSSPPGKKKLLLFEADEKNFLNIYQSKDMKKIFLLSGNHHTNNLFLIQCKDKSRKGIPHYELRLIKLVGRILLRGKYFLEHFRHHVLLINKGHDKTEVFTLHCDALPLHSGQMGRVKKRQKEKIFFPTHSVHITKEEVSMDSRLRRIIILQNCILQDFDMNKYGLVLYTYRYFLKPFICVLYLFVKRGGKCIPMMYPPICGEGYSLSTSFTPPNRYVYPQTGINKRKENVRETRLVAKMKVFSVPIIKGSIQCGLNNLFQSHIISVYICNPFVSSTRVVIDLRRGVVALPRNIQMRRTNLTDGNPAKEEGNTSFFRAKNNILYDPQLEHIFAKNKKYKIKDIFICTEEGRELPVTLIYRHENNGNLYDIGKESYKFFSQHVEEECTSFTVTTTSLGSLCVNFCSAKKWSIDVGIKVEEHLPLFIKPSKTIINVYPFYRQPNICSYSDESHFYLLNNFIVVYFHLNGSGGLQGKKKKTLCKSVMLEKVITIRDLTDSINCLKYLNVSDTESMSIYLHSNSGLLGGFLLNGQRKFLQNVILINPMMELFNSLTDEKKPHVHSERLEFGHIDPKDFLLTGVHVTHSKRLSKRGRRANPPKGVDTHNQYRSRKSGRFLPFRKNGICPSKPNMKILREWQNNLLLLHALCPYNNIEPTYSEVFSTLKQSDDTTTFKLSVTNHRDNPFTSSVLLYLNKYDIICPNVNSVKYFVKYTHYKRVHVRFCYYSSAFHYMGNGVNFLKYHSGDGKEERHKKPLYISFCDHGGHGGFADYDTLLRRTLGRIHFHLGGEFCQAV